MGKIVAGIVLIVLGLGTCVGVPLVWFAGLEPESIASEGLFDWIRFVEPDVTEFEVEETEAYFLHLITRREEDGRTIRVATSDLPDGEYGFVDGDGRRFPIAEAVGSYDATFDATRMEILGTAHLEPGVYRVFAPPTELPLRFAVQAGSMPDAIVGLLIGVFIAIAIVVLGIGLIIVGVVQSNQRKRLEAEFGPD